VTAALGPAPAGEYFVRTHCTDDWSADSFAAATRQRAAQPAPGGTEDRRRTQEGQMSAPNDQFPRDTSGLPAATTSAIVELARGPRFQLRIAPVTKQLGDATLRMLAYNGSIPGPTVELHTRGSALLGWVKGDAEYIAGQIAEHAATANGVADTGAAAEFELRVGQGAVHEQPSEAPPAAWRAR
jgi:hypothetical protein